MEEKERINVLVHFKNGKTDCICLRAKPGCHRNCHPDVVERDKFRGWTETFKKDKYGKSKGGD